MAGAEEIIYTVYKEELTLKDKPVTLYGAVAFVSGQYCQISPFQQYEWGTINGVGLQTTESLSRIALDIATFHLEKLMAGAPDLIARIRNLGSEEILVKPGEQRPINLKPLTHIELETIAQAVVNKGIPSRVA